MLVHRPRKHHHHHAPNKISNLSAKFNETLSEVKKLEEEIARLAEQRNPMQPKPPEEQYFWPKR